MKTIYGGPGKWFWVRSYPQKRYPSTKIWHSHADGGPVLIEESSWRTISGFDIHIGHYAVAFQFRGHGE